MKIKYLNYFFFFLVLSLSMNGCDLFEDEEHCQYTSNESKIWTPSNNPAVAIKDQDNRYTIYFCFERSLNTNSLFKLENVCPFGFIDLNIYPHFDIDNKEYMDEVFEVSKYARIVGLPNESFIRIKDNDIDFVGKHYFIENGVME